MNTQLNLFEFNNYRSFLNCVFDQFKNKNPRFTYGSWAKNLGLKSNTSIIKVLNGQREAGSEIAEKLIQYFKFNPDEGAYFLDLIRLSKAKKDPRLAVVILERMKKKYSRANVKILDEKEFSVIAHWWYYGLRQLIKISAIPNDPIWIAKQFHFKVTPSDIKKAIQDLISLGLVDLENEGKTLRLTKDALDTSHDLSSEALKRFHQNMLENAKISLEKIAVKERFISSMTTAIAIEDLPRAKEFLDSCLDEFCRLFEVQNPDTVFQLQFQLFPLTKLQSKTKGVLS